MVKSETEKKLCVGSRRMIRRFSQVIRFFTITLGLMKDSKVTRLVKLAESR